VSSGSDNAGGFPMNLIFYNEAAKMLDVSIDTIKHAVLRGDLTTAGTQGNRQRLIREQVLLFSGVNPRTGNKKRISYNALSTQEQDLWIRYTDEVTRPASPDRIDEDTIKRVVSQQTSEIVIEALSPLAQAFMDAINKMNAINKPANKGTSHPKRIAVA
jgi:hypothetical protein